MPWSSALTQFGPMAWVVMQHWGVVSGEDVGAMVRRLVEEGVWKRSEEDSWDEFSGGYDFRRVFHDEFPWRVREALGLETEGKGEREAE